MISLRPEAIRSILCIGAHADDIEIGCGGTILTLLNAHNAIDVRWVVLSANAERAEEACRSASRFLGEAGGQQIEIHGFHDAMFPYADPAAIKDCFAALSRSCRPDLIFTHRREDLHQDHRFVAELTWQHFRDHLIFEYEIPKYEGDLGQPGMFVPITSETADRKIETIVSEFQSQHQKPWFDAATLHALLRLRGVECRSPTSLAEAFHCRKLVIG